MRERREGKERGGKVNEEVSAIDAIFFFFSLSLALCVVLNFKWWRKEMWRVLGEGKTRTVRWGGSEGVEGLFFVNDVVVGKVEMSARGV